MEFDLSDSSGTDDDLPPSHQNRFKQSDHAHGNGRSPVVGGTGSFPRVQNDMETQIHNIEQEAYTSVLRAFKAQSDAITWEKESLITELRKELRVSDEEHRELLSRVNANDIIRRIREWRKTNGLQPSPVNSTAQPVHDHIPSPTVSASRKKQKMSQSVGAPSPVVHPSVQPSSSVLRQQGPPSRGKSKKPKSFPSTGLNSRSQVTNRGGSKDAYATNEKAVSYDHLIGKKVWTRWPEDNHFYEAVITDYNPSEGRHALVYDIHTKNETWEWVNLKEISPEDLRWEGEDLGVSHRGGGSRGGPGRGMKKSTSRGGAVTGGGGGGGGGRGRGVTKVQPQKNFALSQNGSRKKKPPVDIEILHTETLIKEVEKVFGSNHPDPMKMEKAKRMLREHEQALINAISRLGDDASDGESDEEPPFSQGQSTNKETGRKKRPQQCDNPGGGGGVEVVLLEGGSKSKGDNIKLPKERSARCEYPP